MLRKIVLPRGGKNLDELRGTEERRIRKNVTTSLRDVNCKHAGFRYARNLTCTELNANLTLRLCCSEDMSIMDAASKGATAGIELIMGIIANLIAFLSFVTFFNTLLVWFCGLLGHDNVTIEVRR